VCGGRGDLRLRAKHHPLASVARPRAACAMARRRWRRDHEDPRKGRIMTSCHPELDRRLAALRDAASDWTPAVSVDAAIASAAAHAARSGRRGFWRTPRAWIAAPVALAASIALAA